MKIAFDYQVVGLHLYGGISRYAYELAGQLASIGGQKVVVVAPLYVNKYLVNAPPSLSVRGLAVPQLPKTRKIYTFLNQFFSKLILRCFQPDIVHETYYSARKSPPNAKVILTVYDMIHERFSDSFSQTDRTSVEKALAVARADHVICISEQTKSDLIEILGVEASKISVVYLGFNLISHDKPVTITVGQSRPFILYVGNREGHKNFERLLIAYATSIKLKNNFDLICFGGGAFSDKEKALMQQLGVSVDRVSQVSGNDVLLASYYRASSAFVYPSLYEGFGIPPLEAMSFDCPVVCSNLSSIPEVVGDAGEMFDPYDPDSIRVAIERVVDDVQLQEVLISRGRERIKLFSWERCAQETLGVYRKVLA